MAAIKLVYIPVQARAEAIKLCLAYGKVQYEEVTPQAYFGCGWGEGAKQKTPYGILPLLEVDGKVINQSGSCVRYCAGLANLIPSDAVTAAQCDALFEFSQDMASINPILNMFRGEVFAAKKADFFSKFPDRLTCLALQLDAQPGAFFFGEQPYYCDFGIYHVLCTARLIEPTALEGQESITKFMTAVEDLEGVKEFLATRPRAVDIGTDPKLVPP